MEHLLFDLINYISGEMPSLMTVDEDYGQLEMIDDGNRDTYPLVFPAVLVDCPDVRWENTGGLSQKGLATVQIKLCIDCYDDTHARSGQEEKILEREEMRRELHRLLQGHRIGNDSALIRTSDRFFTANHGIKVYQSTYSLELSENVEDSAKPHCEKVRLSVHPVALPHL